MFCPTCYLSSPTYYLPYQLPALPAYLGLVLLAVISASNWCSLRQTRSVLGNLEADA